MIAVEIIKRYYYQRGSIIQQLKDDKDLKEAVGILTAPENIKKCSVSCRLSRMRVKRENKNIIIILI